MKEKEISGGDVRICIIRMCWKCNSVANLSRIEPTVFTDAISEMVFECSACSTVIRRTLRN
jgi:hypothetical protein